MALIGFGAYAMAGSMAGAGDAPILWALVAAIAPCLVMNFPPARLFMGDVGAVPLGFIAATFGMSGCYGGRVAGMVSAACFLPFIADASVTLVVTHAARRQNLEAHREHFTRSLFSLDSVIAERWSSTAR